MALEPTNEQREKLLEKVMFTLGKVGIVGKTFSLESTVAASLIMPFALDVAWSFIRDMVLEEAVKVCEAEAEVRWVECNWEDGPAAPLGPVVAHACAANIRALKGKPQP